MEVRVGGGFARLVDCGEFSVLQVSGVGVEDAARAVPGLRVLRVGGGVVVTCNGRPVVPVVGGEPCVELASRVFDRGAWRRARLLVRVGRLFAAGAVAAGLASLFFPPLVGWAGLLAAGSLVLLASSFASLRALARQVAYGPPGGAVEEGGAVGEGGAVEKAEAGFYVEAALLCCEKARRLASEGRSGEAAEYALRALKYASEVVDVEVGGGASPLEVVEAVESAVRGVPAGGLGSKARPPSTPGSAGVSGSAAEPEGAAVDEVMSVVDAYAGGGKSRGGRLEDYF